MRATTSRFVTRKERKLVWHGTMETAQFVGPARLCGSPLAYA